MTMSMPRFGAEASLYTSRGNYASARVSAGALEQVTPQLLGEVGLGDPCRAACRCCAWGNRFCCSHCRWCRGPIPWGLEVSL
jgi:hypothetical protein